MSVNYLMNVFKQYIKSILFCLVGQLLIITSSYSQNPNESILEIQGDTTFCKGDSSLLSLPPNYIALQWNTGVQKDSVYATESGIYTVIAINNLGDTLTSSIFVEERIAIKPLIIGDTILCDKVEGVISIQNDDFQSVQWSTGSTDFYIPVMGCDSMYSLHFIDSIGCEGNLSLSIPCGESPKIEVTAIIQNACKGDSTAAIILKEKQDDKEESMLYYTWSNGHTKSSITGLTEGMYSVTVTNLAGCQTIDSFSIIDPSPLSIFVDSLHFPTCNLPDSNFIQFHIEGGTPPYSIQWLDETIQARIKIDSSLIDSIGGLVKDTFEIEITDELQCIDTLSIIFPKYQPLTIDSTSIQNIFCFQEEKGQIEVFVENGIGPYQYLWSNEDSLSSISTLTEGLYSITITDSVECNIIETFNIDNVDSLGIQIEEIKYADCDYSKIENLRFTIIGGSPPYKIEWLDTSIQLLVDQNDWDYNELKNVPNIDFEFSISDDNGCMDTIRFEIENPKELVIESIQTKNLLCSTDQNGSIDINASGGLGFLTYTWSNNVNGPTNENLESGEYTVTISDETNCEIIEMISISEPDSISTVITNNDIKQCHDDLSNKLTFDILGGSPPYNIFWLDQNVQTYIIENGFTSDSIVGLDTGLYSVLIIDSNECSKAIDIEVLGPDPIDIIQVDLIQPTCHSSNNGSIFVQASGGTNELKYIWSNEATNNINNELAGGTYTVTIVDNNECSIIKTYNLFAPSPLEIIVEQNQLKNCSYDSLNTFSFKTIGGTGDYKIEWLDENIRSFIEETNQSLDSVIGLNIGIYDIKIEDENQCRDTIEIEIEGPDPITIENVEIYPVKCNGDATGGIFLQAIMGGTGNYQLNWSNNYTGSNNNNLSSGNYSLTISDDNNCNFFDNFTIEESGLIEVVPTVTNETQAGLNNGSIELALEGGIGPYKIAWSNNEETSSIYNLSPGTYDVTITDHLDCTKEESYIIQSGSCNLLLDIATNDVKCFGNNDGSVQISLENFVAPYELYLNGNLVENLMDLSAGDYLLVVADAGLCQTSSNFTITEPDSISASIIIDRLPTCFDINDGAVHVEASGGSGDLSFTWDESNQNAQLENIGSGEVSVTVKDNNNCITEASLDLPYLDTIHPTLVLNSITVYLDENGNAEFPDLEAFILDNEDNCGATNLKMTTDIIPLTCISDSTISIQIISEDENENTTEAHTELRVLDTIGPTIFLDTIHISRCDSVFFGNIFTQFSDNCGLASFSWPADFSPFGPFDEGVSSAELSVIDLAGNITKKEIIINNQVQIDIQFETIDPSCFNYNDGFVDLSLDGTNQPLKAFFEPGINPDSLIAGDYQITVSDKTGCFRLIDVTLQDPDSLYYNIDGFDNQKDVGFIDLSLIGGKPPYSTTWFKNGVFFSTELLIESLDAGVYSMFVSDDNGCTFWTETFTIEGVSSTIEYGKARKVNVVLYPNPTTDILNIRFNNKNEEKYRTIEIFDLTGKSTDPVIINEYQLDVSTLSTGMYFIKITGMEGFEIVKFYKI